MRKHFGTGWKDQSVSKGLLACVSVAVSEVLVGHSNWYLRWSWTQNKIPGVLEQPKGPDFEVPVEKLFNRSLRIFPTGAHNPFSSSARLSKVKAQTRGYVKFKLQVIAIQI